MNDNQKMCHFIYSRLSKCSKAMGSSTGISLADPTKVNACYSFKFSEGFTDVENNTFVSLVNLQIAHKMMSQLSCIAGTQNSNNPKPILLV